MLNSLPVAEDKTRKLARYIAHGVDPAQAGIAVGLNLSEVGALQGSPDWQEILQEERAEIVNSQVDINKMYDQLERDALRNLQQTAQISMDPELNMRIAIMANRAQRKGSGHGPANEPLNGKGGQVKISLGINFINKVKEVGIDKAENAHTIEVEATEVNAASQSQVESTFKALDVSSVDPLTRLAKMGQGES